MGVWGCRHKRRQRHSFETQLSVSDERCQKESLYYYYFLIPGIFPNVISPMGAIFYTCVLL